MATFISTVLNNRTSSADVTFNPKVKDGRVGYLEVNGDYQGLNDRMSMSSALSSAKKRTTTVKFYVPLNRTVASGETQVPMLISTAVATLTVEVPDGTPTADVNDLVGYVNAFTASTLDNGNDLLVNGVGVY
jgi:hypothetical protein